MNKKFNLKVIKKLFSIVFLLILITSYSYSFAIGALYVPGEILDPLCAPETPNCTVTAGGGNPSGSNTQIQFNNNGLFGSSSDLTWTSGSAGTPFSIGSDVTFTKADYESPFPVDNISSFVHITRAASKGIYNSVTELSYDDSGYLSPLGTEWNSQGWGDLTDVDTRTYTTFANALDYDVGNKILGAELVMHDIGDDKYYKFDFTAWTKSGAGGGYSYTRNLINLSSRTENILTSSANLLITGDNKYINFGTNSGKFGYGLRDNNGVVELKNGGGSWTSISPVLTLTNGSNLFSSSIGAGTGVGDVSDSNFLGTNAGYNATNASSSNFFGSDSGYQAANASNSNFFGSGAGFYASTASNSNFLGVNAGSSATNSNYSNFLGSNAGYNATNASGSNFLGNYAGYNTTNTYNSNFFGSNAGYRAINAFNSNFIGGSAGYQAANASNSIFLGILAGSNDTVNNFNDPNNFSILIGPNTNTGGFSNSIALGGYAVNTASNQLSFGSATRPINKLYIAGVDYILPTIQGEANSVLTNDGSGGLTWGITSPINYLNTFSSGASAGVGSNASYSNFLGVNAGYAATNASYSNFLGLQAGYAAASASYSNFLGYNAGSNTNNASYSNFLGNEAGYSARNASNSNFLGNDAGFQATNASKSNFLGLYAGLNAINASNSIFIGEEAGSFDLVNNTTNADDFSILIGKKTNTGGFSNSIALGGYATNTATNQFMIGSVTRPIDTTRWNGTGSTQCTLTTGTGIACTSDERLKTNITDLSSDTLSRLVQVKTINFNWKEGDQTKNNIGFLAQDLETYFPELVATDSQGFKSVYYSNMTPILTEAIRELDLKVKDLSSLDTTNSASLGYLIKSFLGNLDNNISDLYAKVIHTDKIKTKEFCLSTDECLNEDELRTFITEFKNSHNTNTTTQPEVTSSIETQLPVAPTENPDNTLQDNTNTIKTTPEATDSNTEVMQSDSERLTNEPALVPTN